VLNVDMVIVNIGLVVELLHAKVSYAMSHMRWNVPPRSVNAGHEASPLGDEE
jgi:hypothetical protein